MSIKYRVYKYQGARIQNWIVPTGVTQARFEAWGASGGMATGIFFQNLRASAGGSGKPAIHFDNNPSNRALGTSYANSAGYAAGTCNVSVGQRFSIAVGGNGQPGFSRIHPDGIIRTGDFVGGAGGWPDGGKGGRGWLATANLYNASSNVVTYTTTGALPASATKNDTWLRTDTNLVYTCNTTYASGGTMGKWTLKSRSHAPVAGSSGGGGGGSTSIMNDDEMSSLNTRIVVAGGSGGSGGLQCANGIGAWQIATSPTDGTAISPPFGLENQQNPPSSTETVWLSVVDYFTSGMGIGGLGGGQSPQSSPTNNVDAIQPSGSWASAGAPGGPATTLHVYGATQNVTNASTTGGGGAGTGQSPGRGGVTAYSHPATGAQQGDTSVNPLASMGGFSFTQGTGGNGADGKPTGADSDWHCGGGGGGGGFHGGGGGGAGYYGGHNYTTFAGGGGGGSNFVMNFFTTPILLGGARPPAASPSVPGSDGTGGLGGFARITYHQPPVVTWQSYPSALDATVSTPVQFSFLSTGADAYSFDIGYSTNLNATVPDVYTTVLVSANSVVAPYTTHGNTLLTYSFPANTFTAGTPVKMFVRCLDADGKPGSADPVRGTGNGDLSAWTISETVQPLAHAAFAPVTLTTPTAGATVPPGVISLGWTVGTQTPLVGYRATLFDPLGKMIGDTGLQFGGSRINLATNPGFVSGGPVWTPQGAVPGTFTNGDTTYPGTSGFNGKVTWGNTHDGSSMVLSPLFSNKEPGRSYRVMLNVASNTANDPLVLHISILDAQQRIVREEPISLAANPAGQYLPLDFQFTLPNNLTSFYVALLASDSTGTKGNSDSSRVTYLSDFLVEPGIVTSVGGYFDGSHTAPTVAINGGFETNINGWASVASTTVAQGSTAHTGTKGLDITWTPGVAAGQASAAYVYNGLEPGQQYTVSAWCNSASGQATPILTIDNGTPGSANAVSSSAAAADGAWHQITSPTFTVDATGILRIQVVNNNATTTGWVTHVDDVTITGVAVAGAASWLGTAQRSASLLTGTDKTTDTVSLVENATVNGCTLTFYSISSSGAQNGYSVGVSQAISINQTQPAVPTVALTVDNVHGYMAFTITDPVGTYPAVSFNVWRIDTATGAKTRVGTGIPAVNHVGVFQDVPASGQAVTYQVDAVSAGGGITSTTSGTVTTVS